MNSNDDSRSKWLLNPSVYSIGAISDKIVEVFGSLISTWISKWMSQICAHATSAQWRQECSSTDGGRELKVRTMLRDAQRIFKKYSGNSADGRVLTG